MIIPQAFKNLCIPKIEIKKFFTKKKASHNLFHYLKDEKCSNEWREYLEWIDFTIPT